MQQLNSNFTRGLFCCRPALTCLLAQIHTMDGTIYFRAATGASPRNYKSFTARKFLQPDVSSDEEYTQEDDLRQSVGMRVHNASEFRSSSMHLSIF